MLSYCFCDGPRSNRPEATPKTGLTGKLEQPHGLIHWDNENRGGRAMQFTLTREQYDRDICRQLGEFLTPEGVTEMAAIQYPKDTKLVSWELYYRGVEPDDLPDRQWSEDDADAMVLALEGAECYTPEALTAIGFGLSLVEFRRQKAEKATSPGGDVAALVPLHHDHDYNCTPPGLLTFAQAKQIAAALASGRDAGQVDAYKWWESGQR